MTYHLDLTQAFLAFLGGKPIAVGWTKGTL
jgi:hypothetical protein